MMTPLIRYVILFVAFSHVVCVSVYLHDLKVSMYKNNDGYVAMLPRQDIAQVHSRMSHNTSHTTLTSRPGHNIYSDVDNVTARHRAWFGKDAAVVSPTSAVPASAQRPASAIIT